MERTAPFSGRDSADLHRSILQYLSWQMEKGRPYERVRNTPEWNERLDAIRLVKRCWALDGQVAA